VEGFSGLLFEFDLAAGELPETGEAFAGWALCEEEKTLPLDDGADDGNGRRGWHAEWSGGKGRLPHNPRMRPEKVKFMLLAANMSRAVAFYTSALGFEKIFVSEFWSELRVGDAILALHGGHDGSVNPTGLSLQFADVFEAVARIEAAGGTIIEPPNQRDGEPILLGRYRDAEGNEGFVTQYVG